MAPTRKKKISPPAEFIRNSADIINQLTKSIFTPMARLIARPSFEAARDRISDLLNVSSNYYTPDDNKSTLIEIGNNLKNATKSSEWVSRFKKDVSGYTFTFSRKPTQGGEFVFSTMLKTFPGSSVLGFQQNLSVEDKLSVLWAAMSAAGFSFTPNTEKFVAYYQPLVILKDAKSKQKAADVEELDIMHGDVTGIQGLIELSSQFANHTHNQSTQNASFQATLRYEVEVDAFGNEVSVSIRPAIDLAVRSDVVPFMAETDNKQAIDYLSYSWINDALVRATQRAKSTKNLPAVDLRVTSRQLRKVRERFNAAKPRVNSDNFCINHFGLPMYIPPNIDNTEKFMVDHSNFTIGADGYFEHETVTLEWASKIIMTDWFNDVLVYTDTSGKLGVYRLLGYVPLDDSSEYIFLNQSVNHRSVSPVLKNIVRVIDSVVTREEAQANLDAAYTQPMSYNGGKVTEDFNTLMVNFRTRTLATNINPNDPDFHYETIRAPLIKHMFGIDLEELPEPHRSYAAHISAYLKAMSEPAKRAEVTLAVINRLSGVEYFLAMGKKLPAKYGAMKEVAKQESLKRRTSGRLLSEIDIPNLDAGGNLKGFMPHQVKVISDRATGANTGLVGVAPGGGKTLLQLSDVLMKLEANPKWRPIIVTKPRLVKGMISEFNFFSKGKVNVVSLRISQLKYMAQMMRLNTAEAVIRWVKSLPVNTIFVCGYTDFSSSTELYEDLDVPSRVMMTDVALPQFLHLLRILGFEQVSLDESHIIKNMRSRRSRYAFSLLAQAQNKMELSGTLVSNTAVDLIGQSYGLNPMIFGDDVEAFKDEYQLSGGLIKSDQTAERVNSRLRKFTQMSSATKEDWAFVLPDLYDKTLSPELTTNQQKFYQSLMLKAELELKAKLENDRGDEDDDGEGDEEDSDERITMLADASLAKAEQFMVAPDENEQFRATGASGADLISPCVKAIDAQLDQIYADAGADHSNNKTAVFGIHKVASGHFMKYTKHKSLCLHYRAGDEEVIRQFKSNPDKLVLVADSTSLREGENLQMLSHIFDMQATWAPGDFEQLISRMYRPDPKGVYNKDRVTHWWITPRHQGILPTVSSVKLARMISKAISTARFKYDGDPRWHKISYEFDDLDLLKMNLQTIFHTDHNDLAPYFNAWAKFVTWEREINQETRSKIAEELEAQNPGLKLVDAAGRVLDRNMFTKLVMREAKSTKTLPGSKRVYTPWEKGAVPADMHDLSLSILGDDKIEVGAYVITEFGPGIVHNVGENQLIVELYGLRKVKLYRDRIAIPNGEGEKKLTALIMNQSAWQAETFTQATNLLSKIDPDASLAPKGKKIRTATAPVPEPSIPEAAPAPKPKVTLKPNIRDLIKKKEEKPEIEEVYTYLINGMPALAILDAPSGVENIGWVPVSPFTALGFKNWTVAENFLKSMTKKFAITKSKFATLQEEMDEFKSGTTMKLARRVTDAQARNFFLSNHHKLAQASDGRDRVDPYWIAIDGNVYLAFSKESHNAKVFTWIRSMVAKNAGLIKKPKEVPEMHINIFRTLSEAAQDLRKLGEAFQIPEANIRQELRELKEDVEKMRGKMIRPVK